MAYATQTDFETYTGFRITSSTTPSSTELANMLSDAERELMDDITEKRIQEYITDFRPPIYSTDGWGQTTGSNTVFFTHFVPIADDNIDGVVDSNDIRVDVYDFDTDSWSEDVAVTSIDARRGKITLSSAPPSNAWVYATYRYYVSGISPNSSRMKRAVCYKAAQHVIRAKSVPHSVEPNYSVGGFSFNHPSVMGSSKKQLQDFEEAYRHEVDMLRIFVGEST